MKYCNACKRHVEPTKSSWNWKIFLPLVLTIVGWIPYVIYHAFIKKENRCPECQTDQLSILSPKERAQKKKERQRRIAMRTKESGRGAGDIQDEATGPYNAEAEGLLKEAEIAFEDQDTAEAIELIDQALKCYDKEKELAQAFPAFKKKALYLYRSGSNDEAWELYNEMYSKCDGDQNLLAQLFEEKGTMLAFEGKHLGALREMVMSKINHDWGHLAEGRGDEIDYDWTENEVFEILAEKANRARRWEEAREVLVEAYDDLENLPFAEVNLKVKKILRK